MTDKSYVSMEQHRCLACGKDYDTGAILLDKRLRESMERFTVTGNGLCPEHTKEGYVTLIAANRDGHGSTVKAGDIVNRTGEVAFVRTSTWSHLFNTPVPPKGVAFVDAVAIEILKDLTTAYDVGTTAESEGETQ